MFELPPAADQDEIANSFTKGLEYALGQFPILAGTLHNDAARRRLSVTKQRESSVTLVIKEVHDEPGGPLSFQYLNERDFPVQLLDARELLPSSIAPKQLVPPLGDFSATGTIMSTFQLTFIPGGLIVALAIRHSCADGDGCNTFLATWAEGAAASRHGRTASPKVKTNAAGQQLSATAPDRKRWQQLDGKFPILKDLGKSPPSLADFQMPALKVRMWHFPRSSTAKLKAESSPVGRSSWISTYDAIVGLLWKTITRAKLPLLNPALSKTTMMGHSVSARNLLQPKLDQGYLGNAIVISTTPPVPIHKVLAEGNLPKLAASIRESIKAVTPQAASEMVEWTAGLQDPRFVTIALDAFMGMDFGVASWQAMTPYEKHDFGFGPPKALRLPHPQFEGYVFVMPSRRAVKPEAADEGIEVCVCLEASSHDRLMQDPELLQYAQPRGNDA